MSVSDPILWVELLMLSALLTAGICVAWTDLRFQRVPNRYTLGQWRPAKGHRGPWLQAAAGLGALLGLALSFAHLVLHRPLSYLEAFAFLVLGYRLLEWGLEPDRRPVVVIPGLAALALLTVTTGGWSHYVLMWGAASLVELAFQQVRHGSGRAFGHKLPAGQLQPGAVLRRRMVLAGDDGAEVIWESGESLDQEAVQLLQKRAAGGDLPDTIELTRTLPGVPFVVAGALATAVFGGHPKGRNHVHHVHEDSRFPRRLHRQRGRRPEEGDPARGLGRRRADGWSRGVEHARQGAGQHLLLGGLVPQHEPSCQLQHCVSEQLLPEELGHMPQLWFIGAEALPVSGLVVVHLRADALRV